LRGSKPEKGKGDESNKEEGAEESSPKFTCCWSTGFYKELSICIKTDICTVFGKFSEF